MSDQESQIRELLQELAEDVPVPHTAPTSLLRRAARRRVRTVMVAVLAVGAGAAIGMSLLTRAGTPPPNVRERAGTELVPQLVSTVDLPAHPSRISVGAGSLWVVNKDDGSQSQFDPTTGRKIGKVVRSSSVDITAANDQVVAYSASGSRSAVTVFDRNHRSIETVPLPGASRPLGRVAIGPHALWVARWALGGRAPGQVMKIISKRIVATIEVSPGEGGLAVGPDAIWVTDARRGLLQRIDLTTLDVTTTDLGGDLIDVTVGYGSVWVSDAGRGVVYRLDPSTAKRVVAIPVPGGAGWLAAGAGGIWSAGAESGMVSFIDPGSNQVRGRPVDLDGRLSGIAVGAGGVWVANTTGRSVAKIGLDRLSGNASLQAAISSTGLGL